MACGSSREPLRFSAASTCLPVTPRVAYAAVESLAAEFWGARVVYAKVPELVVHSIPGDAAEEDAAEESECWLSWTFRPVATIGTCVTLTQSELVDASETAPAPELERVLCILTRRALGADTGGSSTTPRLTS